MVLAITVVLWLCMRMCICRPLSRLSHWRRVSSCFSHILHHSMQVARPRSYRNTGHSWNITTCFRTRLVCILLLLASRNFYIISRKSVVSFRAEVVWTVNTVKLSVLCSLSGSQEWTSDELQRGRGLAKRWRTAWCKRWRDWKRYALCTFELFLLLCSISKAYTAF